MFRVPRLGVIAGCYVTQRHDHPRRDEPALVRDGMVV